MRHGLGHHHAEAVGQRREHQTSADSIGVEQHGLGTEPWNVSLRARERLSRGGSCGCP